jgi:uncharacterized membrane protein YuzA (DUF378 family)
VKFSVAQLLYGMVVFALIAAIIGAGANGSPLAYGIGVSVCTLVIYFLLFAFMYWATLFITGGRKQSGVEKPHSELPKENEA